MSVLLAVADGRLGGGTTHVLQLIEALRDALPVELHLLTQTGSPLLAEAGRQRQELCLAYKLFLSLGEAKAGAFAGREPGTGSHAEICDDIKRLFDLGFETIIIRQRGASAAEQQIQIERFISEIVAKV